MNSAILFCGLAILVASVQGGSKRLGRQGGWNAPPPGWGPPPGPTGTSISETGASQAIGYGAGVAEQAAAISVSGSVDVPALLSLGGGSNVGLSQSVSNYQQTQINNDGSSAAYQSNYGSNDAYADEYLYGQAQGLNVDAISTGWSSAEGEGQLSQVDALDHTGPGGSGSH